MRCFLTGKRKRLDPPLFRFGNLLAAPDAQTKGASMAKRYSGRQTASSIPKKANPRSSDDRMYATYLQGGTRTKTMRVSLTGRCILTHHERFHLLCSAFHRCCRNRSARRQSGRGTGVAVAADAVAIDHGWAAVVEEGVEWKSRAVHVGHHQRNTYTPNHGRAQTSMAKPSATDKIGPSGCHKKRDDAKQTVISLRGVLSHLLRIGRMYNECR